MHGVANAHSALVKLSVPFLSPVPLFRQQSRQVGSHFSSDPVALAFLPAVGPMMAATYMRGGKTEEVRGPYAGCFRTSLRSYYSQRGEWQMAGQGKTLGNGIMPDADADVSR
jgi:hypothetical protein